MSLSLKEESVPYVLILRSPQKYSSKISLSAHLYLHKNQPSLFTHGSGLQRPFLQQYKEHIAIFLQILFPQWYPGQEILLFFFFSQQYPQWDLLELESRVMVYSHGQRCQSSHSSHEWTLCQICPRTGFTSHLRKVVFFLKVINCFKTCTLESQHLFLDKSYW